MRRIKKEERDKYFSQTELVESGWTAKLIKTFLPEPELFQNPKFASKAPMKLWSVEVVNRAEEGEEFKAEMAKIEKRREKAQEAAERAVETRRKKTQEIINNALERVSIPVWDAEKLRRLTIDAQNELYRERGYLETFADDPDEATLHRWEVNFLRHRRSDYDAILYELEGKVGKIAAYQALKGGILSKIAEAYPHLAEECERQRAEIMPH